MRKFQTAVAIAAVTAALGLAHAASATQLLVNGSFEDTGAAPLQGWGGYTFGFDTGTTGTDEFGGPNALPGWTINSGNVDVTSLGSPWGPAFDGVNSLDIDGWEPGSMSQTFNTVAGATYTVSFVYSRNAAGAVDPATATVSAGGVTDFVSAPNDGSLGSEFNFIWKPVSFNFVGTGSPTTLTVTGTNGTNGGVFFDDFAVNGPVPEPAAWTLMIAGFGLAGAMLRRRRAVALAA
ncbi:PEPxxWA-CTERM sorting domain-containing protein [Phenylobacterium sp.]|jgi:hypothetical protein|uniref:PEPxxWA-CTERM sorting domain-containing protein n=1 Tax=Phenylobacterium sp. TaxID=1871053 RepID=UPI002F40778A